MVCLVADYTGLTGWACLLMATGEAQSAGRGGSSAVSPCGIICSLRALVSPPTQWGRSSWVTCFPSLMAQEAPALLGPPSPGRAPGPGEPPPCLALPGMDGPSCKWETRIPKPPPACYHPEQPPSPTHLDLQHWLLPPPGSFWSLCRHQMSPFSGHHAPCRPSLGAHSCVPGEYSQGVAPLDCLLPVLSSCPRPMSSCGPGTAQWLPAPLEASKLPRPPLPEAGLPTRSSQPSCEQGQRVIGILWRAGTTSVPSGLAPRCLRAGRAHSRAAQLHPEDTAAQLSFPFGCSHEGHTAPLPLGTSEIARPFLPTPVEFPPALA